MLNIKTTMLAILICTSQQIISQSNNISGEVIDNTTGMAISNVVVGVINTNNITVTDENGLFHLSIKNTNEVKLIFSHISYINMEVKITPEIMKSPIIIKLEKDALNLGVIEIMGEKNIRTPFSIAKIDIKQLDETNLTDIGAVLAMEPNIGGVRKGATGIDPVVRGFKYSQVSVQLNDGTRIEGGCPNRMDPTASHININDISSISIYKGPFVLKYGSGFGGLIILETHKPIFYNKYENHISLILGGQTNQQGTRTGIRVVGGNSIISYLFSTNWNKYGDYTAGNGDIIKASSNNYNVVGGIGIRPASGHVINLSVDRSWGRNVDFPTLPMDERKDDTQIFQLSYLASNFKNSVNFIKVAAYYSDVNHVMDNKNRPFSDTVVAISSIHAIVNGGKVALNMDVFKGNLEFGSNFEQIRKDGNRDKQLIMQPNLPSITENLWNNAKINNLGIYAEYQKIINRLNWVIALRTDFNSAKSDPMLRVTKNGDLVYENTDTDSEYFNLSFSAGLSWQINLKSEINFSVGKGTRSPDMTERFIILLPVGYDPYDYLGNPKLLPENNHELDIGYTHDCTRSGYFNASVFFSYVTDYISAVILPPSQVKPQTSGVLGVKKFINIDEAYLYGFEILYNTPQKNKWQIKFNTAYTAGVNPTAIKYVYDNGEIIDEISIHNDPLPEIPPLESNIWFRYKFFKNRLTPEINIRMVAKQNKISKAYDEQNTPGFNLINFKVSYVYSQRLNINLGVNNIFDINYYEHLNRRIIGTHSPFYEPGRLFYTNLIINL